MTQEIIWEKLSRYAFLFLIFIFPLWILPYTIFPLEFNKAFLFYAVTIFACVFWFISILQKGAFRIPKSIALLALTGIVIVWFVSSLFASPNLSLSLIGSGHELSTFLSLTFLAIGLFLISVNFQSAKAALFYYLLLFASSLIVFIFQFFHSGFGINLFPWNIFQNNFSNTIGSWNEVGIFSGFIGILAAVLLEFLPLSKRLKIFLLLTLIVSLAGLFFVNFTTAWIVFGSFLVIFSVYLLSVFPRTNYAVSEIMETTEIRRPRRLIRFVIPVILIAIFCIFARILIGDFISSLGINFVEIRPAWNSTWQVIKSVLKENVLLGSGPNTFWYDWSRFKPADLNLTLFWEFPFRSGIGLLPSMVAETGILGVAAWFAFLVFVLFYGLKAVAYSEDKMTRALLFASFFGSLYLWTFVVIYTPGFLLLALAFLTTGILIALLCQSGRIKVIEASFLNNAKLSFISSLIVVFLLITSVATFYLLSQKYWAAYSFGKGMLVFNTTGNIDEAEVLINRASRFDAQDRYFRVLSEIGLLRIQQLLAAPNIPADDFQVQLQNLIAYSINSGQSATRANPLDFSNWMSLGLVYESLLPLQIAGSGEAAINAYKEAAKHAPFDPRPLFTAGRVAIQVNDFNSAKSYFGSAVNLKGDYAPALFLLSQVEVQEGNLKGAITRTEQVFLLAPNDIGVLFQLGLLYYQDKNFVNSRLALERVVALDSNYSNARYFLGLIYDNEGRVQDAMMQFERIEQLNPDNQEVKQILTNLREGRKALETISPPQPSPEKRKEAPVDESEVEKELKR
jgi:tetratricopeptide (TPR) repeat protein